MIDLKNKNILVGVTASISIYKTLDLIREFKRANANVRVVMSESAERFVTPLTFEAVSGNEVLTMNTESWANDNNHIAISKWCDAYLIAPISANSINKLSNGLADNLITQIALACTKPIIIAPAANTNMIQNPLTLASLKMLGVNEYTVIPSQEKLLVCGDTGDGGLAEIEDIFYTTARILLKEDFWEHRKVVLSGGGTKESIDDIRYIGNNSSGKMANALALSLYTKGADVCIVRCDDLYLPNPIHSIKVSSSKEMQEYLSKSIEFAKTPSIIKPTLKNNLSSPKVSHKKPYLFMTAAVSDYIPQSKISGKIKKEDTKTLNLNLKQNTDILKSLELSNIISIGFKAETNPQTAKQNAINTLKEKNLDAICLNIINEDNNFGSATNQVTFITQDNENEIDLNTKQIVANEIITLATKLN